MTRYALVAIAALVASVTPAGAHVAPSRDTNNRYLKLTPMRDRVRLAYTVYIGEVPGVQARRRMDRDGNGMIDEAESRVYGDEIAAAVRRDLEITMDGAPIALDWSEIHVGMGTPATSAGAFSVDLIGWICSEPGRSRHSMILFDRYRVPRPGETELHVQVSPGITVIRSGLGRDADRAQLEFRWLGGSLPVATLGHYMDFSVDPAAMPVTGSVCGAKPEGEGNTRAAALAAAAAAALGLGAALIGWRAWRRGGIRTSTDT